MIHLDGSHGEGGGQIIRTALALSCVTQKPFCITKIRENRPDTGLKNQHLHCIKALKELCDARVVGDILGSTALEFYPGPITARTLAIDIGTAGSIPLLLQCLMLPCLHTGHPIKLTLKGGTDVRWSPSIDYFTHVIIPYFKRYALIDVKLIRRGYYPKGQGEVAVRVSPMHSQKPLELMSTWNRMCLRGISHASADLQHAQVAERQAHAAQVLLEKYGVVTIQSAYAQTASSGSGITLWALYSRYTDDIMVEHAYVLGADALGEHGKRAEVVGEEAARKLIAEMESGEPVDQHAADTLIPLLGLMKGKIKVSHITEHTRTNIHTTEQFLDVKFQIDETQKIIAVD